MGQAQTQRLAPEERRALLVDAAERTFAAKGYTQAGLAEVATRAGVSKTLLYHYFPEGRRELYAAVMAQLVEQIGDAVRAAVDAPVPAERRLTSLVGALITYFERNPDAYRLLILEPWGSGDSSVLAQATAARARLASELNQLLSAAGEPLPVTLAGGAAAMGAILHVSELAATGQLPGDQATEVAQRFVEAGLHALDLI